MKNMNYYNDFDKNNCIMLGGLMKDGLIPQGVIDNRPIQEVTPKDLDGFQQCHFFAGMGGWVLAARLAGLDNEEGLWTGSCPCQPFSNAGKQKGKEDERHIWPEWLRLIRECKPTRVFGEQVAAAITHGWLDDVCQGLEAEGYSCGAAVLPACSVGAPHRRERLFFVAKSEGTGGRWGEPLEDGGSEKLGGSSQECRPLANTESKRFAEKRGDSGRCEKRSSRGGSMGDTSGERPQGHWELEQERCTEGREVEKRHTWETGVWVRCADGKARLIEPSVQLLAHGVPERMALLHAVGNAIVPQVAAEFMKACS